MKAGEQAAVSLLLLSILLRSPRTPGAERPETQSTNRGASLNIDLVRNLHEVRDCELCQSDGLGAEGVHRQAFNWTSLQLHLHCHSASAAVVAMTAAATTTTTTTTTITANLTVIASGSNNSTMERHQHWRIVVRYLSSNIRKRSRKVQYTAQIKAKVIMSERACTVAAAAAASRRVAALTTGGKGSGSGSLVGRSCNTSR